MLNLFDKKTKKPLTLFPHLSKSNYNYTDTDLTKENKSNMLNEKIGDTRHYPPASKEWINSVYSYNKSFIKTLPITDNAVNRLIKSFFSLSPLFSKKKSRRVEIRFRRLSLNRILVSKSEIKHTNNKVIITVYLYNRNKKFLISKLKNLYKRFIFSLPSINSNTKDSGFGVKLAGSKRLSNTEQQNNKGSAFLSLKGNKPYNTLKRDKTTSNKFFVSFKPTEFKIIKDSVYPSAPSVQKKAGVKKSNSIMSTKQNFSTKRKSVFNKSNLLYPSYKGSASKIYNYINFTELSKARLSKFLYKMKNTNLKNKYKTLLKKYYSILSKYKLYSIVNENSYLNFINLPIFNINENTASIHSAGNTSSFYKLLKINNGTFGFKTRRNIYVLKNNQGFASRKVKNLMHKIRSFYKLFSLNGMYNYKTSANIAPNAETLNINSLFGNISKMLKKSLVSQAGKKINLITLKAVRILKRARKHKNFIIKTLKWSNENFTNYENKYYKRFIRKAYKKEMLYLYYIRMLALNNNKFKNWFLLGLKKVISKIYNKNVEFNLVNLKYLHLNSDIFTESIAVKLKNRQNRLLSVLKKALSLVKLPSVKAKSPISNGFDFSEGSKNNISLALKKKYKGLNINSFSSALLENNDTLHKLLGNIFPNSTVSSLYSNKSNDSYIASNPLGQQKDVLDSIKHKAVFGVRLEAAGRLSKRLTASRSVFKLKYKGSLKNIDSSYKGMSSVILKGNTKSNIQYTKVSSKTRNGSFGLKGWVSGY